MLGKGLESLIPPQRDDDNGIVVPQEPPRPPVNLTGHHLHDEDAGPQILSFDFIDNPSNIASEDFGGQETPVEVIPAVAAAFPVKETGPIRASLASQAKRADGGPASRESVAPAAVRDYVFHVETAKIRPNPNQPRRDFPEAGLWELAKSIREFGFLQPLVVTRKEVETASGIDVEYELIAGERRLLAAKLLGLDYVPAIVRAVDLEREKLELAVIENIQREDLNPIEKARAFQRLQEEFRLTQREIAAKLGKSRETVANTVRLLDLPMYAQEAIAKGEITESHGRFLLQIGDPAAQKKLFEDIVANALTTRDVKQRVQTARPRGKARGELPPELKMFEERLAAELGAPVKIEQSANNGKIVITFYSEEELKGIISRIGRAI